MAILWDPGGLEIWKFRALSDKVFTQLNSCVHIQCVSITDSIFRPIAKYLDPWSVNDWANLRFPSFNSAFNQAHVRIGRIFIIDYILGPLANYLAP